jgi:hypothetical protein
MSRLGIHDCITMSAYRPGGRGRGGCIRRYAHVNVLGGVERIRGEAIKLSELDFQGCHAHWNFWEEFGREARAEQAGSAPVDFLSCSACDPGSILPCECFASAFSKQVWELTFCVAVWQVGWRVPVRSSQETTTVTYPECA